VVGLFHDEPLSSTRSRSDQPVPFHHTIRMSPPSGFACRLATMAAWSIVMGTL
jgi:hypothetical protein